MALSMPETSVTLLVTESWDVTTGLVINFSVVITSPRTVVAFVVVFAPGAMAGWDGVVVSMATSAVGVPMETGMVVVFWGALPPGVTVVEGVGSLGVLPVGIVLLD